MNSSDGNAHKLPFLTRFFRAVAQDLIIPKGAISKKTSAEAGICEIPADKEDIQEE